MNDNKNEEKTELTLKLTPAQCQTIIAHLQAGVWWHVNEVLAEVTAQVAQQVCSSEDIAIAQAAAEVKVAGPHIRKN